MIHENIRILESELKMPLVSLPVKTVLVKTAKGLLMISPLPDIEQYKEQTSDFGEVTDIIAPNLFHNLGVQSACHIYPKAKLWGAQGFKEKMPQLNWDQLITKENWPFSSELPIYLIAGMPKMNEVVFHHPSSNSIIVSDLCFNHIHGKGFGYWLIFHIFGTYKKFAVSKLFLKMVKDKTAFKKSLSSLFQIDFENIILPHGENIIGGAKEKLKEAFAQRDITGF